MEPQPFGGRLADPTLDRDGAWDAVGSDAAWLLAADRERIGHDLHDLVIRSLFEVSLKLHGALPLIADDRAERRVGDALADIDQVISNVRLAVFALLNDRPWPPERGLRGRVVDLIDDVGRRIDHHPSLALDGPIDAMTDIRMVEGLILIIRELLTGLVRHAGARTSQVGLAARLEPQPHLRVQIRGELPCAECPSDLRAWLDDVRDLVAGTGAELVTDVKPHVITLSWIVPMATTPP